MGAETKKGSAPQLLTESAGTHPPHRGHGQNVKICGERRWIRALDGMSGFRYGREGCSFCFVSFCCFVVHGTSLGRISNPRRLISTSRLDLCRLDCGLHGLPTIPTGRHRDTEIQRYRRTDRRTGHSGSDAVELAVCHIIVPWRLDSSDCHFHPSGFPTLPGNSRKATRTWVVGKTVALVG